MKLFNLYNPDGSPMELPFKNAAHGPNAGTAPGLITMLGTYILFIVLAYFYGGYDMFWADMSAIWNNGFLSIANAQPDFLGSLPLMMAVVTIELPLCILAGVLVIAVLGKHREENKVSEEEAPKDPTVRPRLFFLFFVIVFAEEVFARQIFLGWLMKLNIFSEVTRFWVLFMVGNLIWALAHLGNYSHPDDKHPARVLPQFIGGFSLTYVYMKYGLMAATLAHFAYNGILFSSAKKQRTNHIDGMIVAYATFWAIVSYFSMDKPISDIAQWFAVDGKFVIEGWNTGDYILLSIFFGSLLTAISGALLFDRGDITPWKKEIKLSPVRIYAATVPGFIILSYGMFWLLSFLTDDVVIKVTIISLVAAFTQRGQSGSAMARVFFSCLPATYISVCIVEALPFWHMLGWIAIESLIYLPHGVLKAYDD